MKFCKKKGIKIEDSSRRLTVCVNWSSDKILVFVDAQKSERKKENIRFRIRVLE